MKSLVMYCLLLILAAASAADLQQAWDLMQEEFNAFKLQYNKVYASEAEEQMRLQNFLHSRQEVALHNARYAQGLVGFRLGINEFSDMTHEEFVRTHNGVKMEGFVDDVILEEKHIDRSEMDVVSGATFIPPPDDVKVADEVDWRKDGAVTPVKDQAECSSCWAFSATGSLEGQIYRKKGILVSLSEQNLIDCSTMYGNEGCNGGTVIKSFKYIRENGGINKEADYPYEKRNNWCSYNASKYIVKDVGFVNVPADEESLKKAVATLGPISASIDGSLNTFQAYASDTIYYDPSCSSRNLTHAVLVVGYGADNGQDYWLIKNSYGLSWGIAGYMKLARNRGNHCGVATAATYPLISG